MLTCLHLISPPIRPLLANTTGLCKYPPPPPEVQTEEQPLYKQATDTFLSQLRL